ncbi:bifunctional apoptosis regulator-like [Gigantopelta aegis]|uniref:bifunctional apoptosis regulator-like n=1 Tax=Gigantopelta aegis TaxID=1735272 RepID=UPI001B88ABB9|nr:bifunctional apoptosis regulator-like [Gigantopelta aegis]
MEEETENSVSQERQLMRSDSENDFLCSCCYGLLIQPTTLVCGHNFCRLCLAQWFLTSKKKECPTCRQQWQGHPQVNITLRNMMERMLGSRVSAMEEELKQNTESQAKIEEFNKQLSNSSKPETDLKSFCFGICITLCVIIVAYLAWYWRNSDADLLIHKPVTRWKMSDVEQWLGEMGWASDYIPAVHLNHVDGNMLLALDENNLRELLNVTNPLHEKALLYAIHDVREKGIKMPGTLWEYKARYPGRTLFLLFGLKDFPRTTLLYLYFFNYEDVFLPFVHFSTPQSKPGEPINWSEISAPTSEQWILFMTYLVLLPYWLVIKVAWSYTGIHYWTSWFIIVSCSALTVTEASLVKSYFMSGQWRSTLSLLKQHFKLLLSMSIFVIIWPIVPRLICDFFFYATLYFSPIQLMRSFYNNHLLGQ